MTQQDNTRRRNHKRCMVVIQWFLMAWIGAAVVGILLYESSGHRDESTAIHMVIMSAFDRIFKKMGGLVVAMAWSARVAIKSCMYAFSPTSGTRMSSSEHIWFPALLYTFQGIIRAWIYNVHLLVVDATTGHMMSDHVLLSSSIVAGLVCELYLIVTSKSIRRQWSIGSLLLYILVGILSVLLCLLIIHVYTTARYHHSPWETVASILLGSALFTLTGHLSIRHQFHH